jgi:hypothetical protein
MYIVFHVLVRYPPRYEAGAPGVYYMCLGYVPWYQEDLEGAEGITEWGCYSSAKPYADLCYIYIYRGFPTIIPDGLVVMISACHSNTE